MSASLAMGGYGAYVWSCFGLTFIVLVICVWQARTRQAKTYREIAARLKAMEASK